MNLGELVKTKTFWGGLSAIVTGVIMITQGAVDTGITSIFAGLQTIFIRDAIIVSDVKTAKALTATITAVKNQ